METLGGGYRRGFAGHFTQDSAPVGGSGGCSTAPSGRLRSPGPFPRFATEASLINQQLLLFVRARDLNTSRSPISTDLQNGILNMARHAMQGLPDATADSAAVQADSRLQRKLERKYRSFPQSTPPEIDESLQHEVPDAERRVNEWMLTATELREVKTAVLESESKHSVPFHVSLINKDLTETGLALNMVNPATFPLPTLSSRLRLASEHIHGRQEHVLIRGLNSIKLTYLQKVIAHTGLTSHIAGKRAMTGVQGGDKTVLR